MKLPYIFQKFPSKNILINSTKWDRKADCGVLLSYTDLGYRVLVNNRVIVTRHIKVVDETVKCISFQDDEIKQVSELGGDVVQEEEVVPQDGPQVSQESTSTGSQEPTGAAIRRSSCDKRPPAKLSDCVVTV